MRKLSLLLGLGVVAAWVAGDEGLVPRDVRTDRFATAVVCAVCHANADDSGAHRDIQGRGVAPYDLWRSSMMANAARDPFFQAAVAAEVHAHPEAQAEIEARCLTCHAPMASVEARHAGRRGLALADLERQEDDDDDDRAALARDGVSCTLCHQILEEGLGKKESFDGAFQIGDTREIFGPHDKLLGIPMHRVTKYWPVPGQHIMRSAQCATCHTAFVNGVPELAAYLEWRNSDFNDETDAPGPRAASCQACHVPVTSRGGAQIRTRIARTSHGGDILTLEPREPVGRHLFVGGNTLIPAILRDHADALHVKAPAEAFDATIARTREQLRERTARIEIEEVDRGVESVYFVVSVQNLTGHKFPTGHGSRRAWLRVKVRDSKGTLVFVSGETDAQGRIVGADGKPLVSEIAGGPVALHRKSIEKPDEVQVYEAVLADAKGAATFITHRAHGRLKDNRLLPAGWSAKHPDGPATAPAGTGGDADFAAGSDKVVYQVPFPENDKTFTVDVELLYQPLSSRHAAELFLVDVPQVRRFRAYFDAADRTPEVVARARFVGGQQD